MEILDMAVTALIVLIAAIYVVRQITSNKGCSSCANCSHRSQNPNTVQIMDSPDHVNQPPESRSH
ncbi:MAG: hypothetical protein GY737_04090 [Desulfobacteraceae bacterium]|nr:hypothetical protein [Desulfobacteraceae bacterium]